MKIETHEVKENVQEHKRSNICTKKKKNYEFYRVVRALIKIHVYRAKLFRRLVVFACGCICLPVDDA